MRVCDDYEAPYTISGDLTRDLGRPVSDEEVLATLFALAKQGLVQAYVFEQAVQRFLPVTTEVTASEDDPWFMATAEGLQKNAKHAG